MNLTTIEDIIEFKCNICHKTFHDYNAYKQHMRDKHNIIE